MNEIIRTGTRIGEKIGWIGGGTGSVIWIGVVAIILLFDGKITGGVLGIVIMSLGLLSVFFLSPWRNPETQYRYLFLPLYIVLLLSIIWAFAFLDNPLSEQSNPWLLFLLLPMIGSFISPLITVGRKRWKDGEQGS